MAWVTLTVAHWQSPCILSSFEFDPVQPKTVTLTKAHATAQSLSGKPSVCNGLPVSITSFSFLINDLFNQPVGQCEAWRVVRNYNRTLYPDALETVRSKPGIRSFEAMYSVPFCLFVSPWFRFLEVPWSVAKIIWCTELCEPEVRLRFESSTFRCRRCAILW